MADQEWPEQLTAVLSVIAPSASARLPRSWAINFSNFLSAL
jgi:hypothetical protein